MDILCLIVIVAYLNTEINLPVMQNRVKCIFPRTGLVSDEISSCECKKI